MNRINISETGGCVLHSQRAYVTYETGAERQVMSSFVLVKGESETRKKTRRERVPLLFHCAVWKIEQEMNWQFSSL